MNFEDTFTMIFCTLLFGGGFLLFTSMNYYILFGKWDEGEYVPSSAPFIGGISGVMLLLMTIGTKYPLILLIPLLVDPGSIPTVIEVIVLIISDYRKK